MQRYGCQLFSQLQLSERFKTDKNNYSMEQSKTESEL